LPVSPFKQSTRAVALTATALLCVTTVACGRSSSRTPGPAASSRSASSTSAASASAAAPGSFGTLAKVCGPGPGSGGGGRGIAGKTIRLGVLGDPGNTAVPGLGQEFFDVGKAFAKWCNAAGGINGRTIILDTLDAKLFDGAARVIEACQKDFMLVGGTAALDATTVKPREACKLGAIPAYTASPEAYASTLQITPSGSVPTIHPVAGLRLLADAFPESKQGLAIGGSNQASLTAQGLRAQEAWQKLGYKVSALQQRPPLVANFRPYIVQLKQAGAKADFEISTLSATPLYTAMNDAGFDPVWVLFGQAFYAPSSVQAAKAIGKFPPSYVDLSHVPFELADRSPGMREFKDMIVAGGEKTANLDEFSALGIDAWLLWASSATACGSDLTQACVLQKAGATTNWDAGGLFAPLAKPLSQPQSPDCWLVVKLTANGWTYDQSVTQPTQGLYNCSPKNLVTTKSYLTS
jgi:hypothetical protein